MKKGADYCYTTPTRIPQPMLNAQDKPPYLRAHSISLMAGSWRCSHGPTPNLFVTQALIQSTYQNTVINGNLLYLNTTHTLKSPAGITPVAINIESTETRFVTHREIRILSTEGK